MTKTIGLLTYRAGSSRGHVAESRDHWYIEAEPHVMVRLKRIFARVKTARSGALIITDTPETARDIQWCMTRWPLQVADAYTRDRLEERATLHRDAEERLIRILNGEKLYQGLQAPARKARDYQQIAADIVLSTGRLLITDALGLGKSMESLLILASPDALPATVVAMTHLQQQWLEQLQITWPDLTGHIALKSKPYDPSKIKSMAGKQPDVLILSYAKLAGWSDYLGKETKTIIFDEVQELRNGTNTAKGTAAAHVASQAAYKVGLSVGPDSTIELIGGPFLDGWIGSIEKATDIIQTTVSLAYCDVDMTFDVQHLDICSRGWTPAGFDWKPVKTFIRHRCTTTCTAIHTPSSVLTVTDAHSIYKIGCSALELSPAHSLNEQHLLAGDIGSHWNSHVTERPVDITTSTLRGVRNPETRPIDGYTPTLLCSSWAYIMGTYISNGYLRDGKMVLRVYKRHVPLVKAMSGWLTQINIDDHVHPEHPETVHLICEHPYLEQILQTAPRDTPPHAKYIPNSWITTWPETARHMLLIGLMHSAGGVDAISTRCYVIVQSKQLANQLLCLLRSVGMMGALSIKDNSYLVIWRPGYGTFCDDTNEYREPAARPWTLHKTHEVPINAVHPVPSPDIVYDLEMSGHPSFVADGILVHNSASPIYNYGGEVYNILDILAPDALGTREEFGREWGLGSDSKMKVSNPAALGSYLRDQGLMLGRSRQDVGRELSTQPLRITHTIEADTAVLDTLQGDAIEMAKLIVAADTAVADKWRLAGDFDMRMRQITGISKAPYVAEFIKLLLESEARVVVWGWHRAAYDIWMERLAGFHPVAYTGEESPTQKDRNVKEFTTGKSRVLMMSLRAGAGLDGLQEYCHVGVFGELDWSPQVHNQCIGRLDRDGQLEPVTAYFLVSEHGADPVMANVLNLKRQQSDPMINPDQPLFTPIQDNGDRIKRLAIDVLTQAGVAPPEIVGH